MVLGLGRPFLHIRLYQVAQDVPSRSLDLARENWVASNSCSFAIDHYNKALLIMMIEIGIDFKNPDLRDPPTFLF
jgi:hypothetical protein